MRTAKKFLVPLLATTALMLAPLPSDAMPAPTVKSCNPNTDCTTNSANNAVFAVCRPESSTTTCDRGRDVTIQLSGFPANSTVHVWWLNGVEPADRGADDCSRIMDAGGRTHISDAQTDGNGKGSFNTHLPPAGGTPGTWSYGSNWICATTAPHTGGAGAISDQMFTIYPA